ncbi:hypothetical protein [Mucilaginibacter paludis]|uniref:Uncharacterized protein n=1 Tax=Mucilaginibacter paludis DSM 18603 TaxID=714943 RepID=H1YHD7_9SPHI|nr:hypothetical protein [Mucilaginibacter paludis]EHQ25471.1 hypothetical protein Mucpa_1309 [Mucilaginibacter paludis DSM 18603]
MDIHKLIKNLQTCFANHTGLWALLLITSLGSCKKADNYYQKLYDQPEIFSYYNKVYGIGDTLTIIGRLNPKNNLVVHIGDADARVISTIRTVDSLSGNIAKLKLGYSDSLDVVKLMITTEMGVGQNRAISITSAGNTIQVPAIEIVQNSVVGYLPKPLKLVSQYQQQAGARPLFCQNGKGSIYLWNTDGSVTLIKKDGSTSQVFDNTVFKDSFGSFTVTAFNGGGVDPQEATIYFSVVTADGSSDNTANTIYRLCKYDVATKQLTTLNRSLYAKAVNAHTFAAAQPFEGNIAQVKIFQVTGIHPDSQGNVYLDLNSHFITKLSKDGGYKYVFNLKNYNDPAPFIPAIIHPDFGNISTLQQIHQLLPGLKISSAYKVGIDPGAGLLYAANHPFGYQLKQYSLINQVELYAMPTSWIFSSFSNQKMYLSGSFGVLTGPEENPTGTISPAFGYMPLPDQKLVLLLYQEAETNPKWRDQSPAWEMLDFKKKQGQRYAPGKLVRGTYSMMLNDVLLNYDEDGMLYMTANSQKTIAKTAFQ